MITSEDNNGWTTAADGDGNAMISGMMLMIISTRYDGTSAINAVQALLLVDLTPTTVSIAMATDHIHRGYTDCSFVRRVAVSDCRLSHPQRCEHS